MMVIPALMIGPIHGGMVAEHACDVIRTGLEWSSHTVVTMVRIPPMEQPVLSHRADAGANSQQMSSDRTE